MNFRQLVETLENKYNFECTGGALKNCVEWQRLKAYMEMHAGDCLSLDNEVRTMRENRDDDIAQAKRDVLHSLAKTMCVHCQGLEAIPDTNSIGYFHEAGNHRSGCRASQVHRYIKETTRMIPLTAETKDWWERLYVWARSKDYSYLVQTHYNINHNLIKNPHDRFGRWRRQEVPDKYKKSQWHAIWGFRTLEARDCFIALYGGVDFTLRTPNAPPPAETDTLL